MYVVGQEGEILHRPGGRGGQTAVDSNAGTAVDELLTSIFLVSRAVFFFIKGLIKKAEDEMLWPMPRRLHEKTYNIAL